jgi:hypothetical protein
LVAGCGSGDSEPQRIRVGGEVHVSGAPISGASISYLPKEAHRGPAATACIEDGHYLFTEDTGPAAGPHRVLIRTNPPKGMMVRMLDEQKPADPSAHAGGPWEFHVDVPSEGPFQKDFALD